MCKGKAIRWYVLESMHVRQFAVHRFLAALSLIPALEKAQTSTATVKGYVTACAACEIKTLLNL